MSEQTFPSLTGKHVIFVDPAGIDRPALVTADWRGGAEFGCLNVVYTNTDDRQRDNYGQKIERSTSVAHRSSWNVHGNYWVHLDDEERIAYTPPA